MNNSKLIYRHDIDGLRALAIIGVVLFHFFPKTFPGGFVGVDVFFVISGYLITSIVAKKVHQSEFYFYEFYQRRILRIFPALSVVVIFLIALAHLNFTSREYVDLGKELIGASTFSSNFLYWSQIGYFDKASDLKPLLHLWSLAIEEQFYIFWPAFIALTLKRKHFFSYICSIIILSFLLCIYFSFQDQNFAFYMPFTRFWEIILGGFVSLFESDIRKKIKFTTEYLSLAGLFLLAYLFFSTFMSNTFPGYIALLPCFATLLILSLSPGNYLYNILSNSIFKFFGHISYPLYLWHWVLLSSLRIFQNNKPTTQELWVALILSVLLSWLTYELVEKKIKRLTHSNPKRRKKFTYSFLALVLYPSQFKFQVGPSRPV